MKNNMLNNLYNKYEHAVKFILVGSLNTFVDLGFFFIFANILKIEAVVASILSTAIAMCLSFFLNHGFVFQSSTRKRDTVIQFVAITAFNVWLVQSIVIALSLYILKHIALFNNHKWTLNIAAKLCGVSVSFILNFIMYRYIFHKNQARKWLHDK